MKIYVVVKHTDVEIGTDGEYITKTGLVGSYGKEQDAKFETKYLNNICINSDNITYDYEELELY